MSKYVPRKEYERQLLCVVERIDQLAGELRKQQKEFNKYKSFQTRLVNDLFANEQQMVDDIRYSRNHILDLWEAVDLLYSHFKLRTRAVEKHKEIVPNHEKKT